MNGAKRKLNEAIGKGAETSAYVKALVNSHIELKKIETSAALGKVLYSALLISVISVLAAMVLFFALFALLYWLIEVLGAVQAFVLIVLIILAIAGLFLLLGSLFKKKIKQGINQLFFKSKEAPEKEVLKSKIQKLEHLVQDSSQEIPASVKQLSFGDFMPGKGNVVSSSFWKKVGNSPISGWLASLAIAFAEKKIRKKK